MTIINGVDTNSIDYGAIGNYIRAQQGADIGNYVKSQQLASINNAGGFGALGAYMGGGTGSNIEGPDPTELAAWANQRRQIADVYGNTNARLDFDRNQAQLASYQETRNFNNAQDQKRTHIPGGFARRGLLDSGVYGGALQQYGQDRANGRSDLALKFQSQLGNLGVQQQQAQTSYTSGTQQVDASEAARRQSLASQLKGVI